VIEKGTIRSCRAFRTPDDAELLLSGSDAAAAGRTFSLLTKPQAFDMFPTLREAIADVPDNVVICDLWTLNGVPFIRLDRFRSEKPKVIKLVFAQAIGLSG
jgi:hypothetical protein